jgi:Thioesterase-like superfamily
MEPAAFYLPAGAGRFETTPATAGPWSAGAQHGGPPSALLARAFERLEPDPCQRLARLTIEILRPIPVRPVTVEARVVRPGRRVTLIEGSLGVDGEVYLLARAWRIVRPATPTPARGARAGSPPLPEPGPSLAWEGAFADGYMRAIDMRQTSGTFAGPGPAGAWMRPRVPLVAGEEPSPFQRAVIVADSGSGVSQGVDNRAWLAINVELTLSLHRDPAGEWIHLESHAVIGAEGTGRADTVLGDREGEFGRAIQTLLVAPLARRIVR